MKVFIMSLMSFLILTVGSLALAEKIVVTGNPVVVEQQGDFYVPATTVTSTNDYYYFTFGNTKRVCYREVQPALAKLDFIIFKVRVGSDVVSMHCYDYNADYFVVE